MKKHNGRKGLGGALSTIPTGMKNTLGAKSDKAKPHVGGKKFDPFGAGYAGNVTGPLSRRFTK